MTEKKSFLVEIEGTKPLLMHSTWMRDLMKSCS